MKSLRSFFEESPGVLSSTRLIYVFGMAWLIIISTIALFTKLAPILEIAGAFSTITAVLGTIKLVQSGQENHRPQDKC
jgi:hypothetical protein